MKESDFSTWTLIAYAFLPLGTAHSRTSYYPTWKALQHRQGPIGQENHLLTHELKNMLFFDKKKLDFQNLHANVRNLGVHARDKKNDLTKKNNFEPEACTPRSRRFKQHRHAQ